MTPTTSVQLSRANRYREVLKGHQTLSNVRRLAFVRWKRHYERVHDMAAKGLVFIAYSSDCWPRARTKAREAARAAGIPWTREMDRSFRAPKKTKALNVTAEKGLEAKPAPAPKAKKSKRSAGDSQPIGKTQRKKDAKPTNPKT